MLIHPFKTTDIDPLTGVFLQNIPKYFAQHELDEFLNYLQSSHANTYFVIKKNDTIIGGAGYEIRKSDASGRINWIFLHPEFQNSGIGKEVVKQIILLLKSDRSINKLIIRTSQFAYVFFEKLGYKTILIEKDHWAPGLDLYLMEQLISDKETPL